MDTKLIQQYGEDILCYRLRTARQKKRMQYEDFDKQLIQLDKKETRLYAQIRNLGWEPLHPPVQKGWIRSFVLRPDVAASKHAGFFEGILIKINTYQYDWRKVFKKKKRKFGRKILVDRPQSILMPEERHFRKLNFSEAEKQFFYEVWQTNNRKELVKRYVFRDDWRFILVVKPYMIDKVRIKDAFLDAQVKQISNYMERNNYRKRQAKILEGHYQWKRWVGVEKSKEINPLKNKSVNQILDGDARLKSSS